jgi:hypothetical protein
VRSFSYTPFNVSITVNNQLERCETTVPGTTAASACRHSGKPFSHNCWCPSKWLKWVPLEEKSDVLPLKANDVFPQWLGKFLCTCNTFQGLPCYEYWSIFKLKPHQQFTCSVSGDVPSQTVEETAGTSVSGIQTCLPNQNCIFCFIWTHSILSLVHNIAPFWWH